MQSDGTSHHSLNEFPTSEETSGSTDITTENTPTSQCSSSTEHGVTFNNSDSLTQYADWEAPTTIVSDGAYGTGSFPGEPSSPAALQEWYEPHVKAWTEHATPETTLWFWNTELGWAEVHSLLQEYGWEYRGANIWNKGIAHIAGNSNTQSLRKFPAVTEICVQYVRSKEAVLNLQDDQRTVQEWLRDEWRRAGLTFDEANDACGVADAATRKYLCPGADWYFPPPERFQQLQQYANKHGSPDGRPYLVPDNLPFDINELEQSGASTLHRAKFDCPAGVTNVWNHPQVSGDERITDGDGNAVHPNQKPLDLLRQILSATTDCGDVVWEPFGGLGTVSVAAKELDRVAFGSEIVDEYYETAVDRLQRTSRGSHSGGDDQAALDSFV